MKTTDTVKAAYEQYVMGNYGVAPLTLSRAEGARVWDAEGNCYLDFISGIAVNTIGHCHPRIVDAIQRQAATLSHCSNLFRVEPQAVLAKHLVERAGGSGKVFFCNSGTEANEALIKLSRLFGQKKANGVEGKIYQVVVAEHAFHGRSFGGMSATPQEKIQKGFRPLVPGFVAAKFNDIDSFAEAIDESTSAVMLETIQGEGGVFPADDGFLRELRALCDEREVLLILDEVQCGIGRTGDFFAFEKAGVQPDAIGMAKGLGGGFPIGAMWLKDEYASLFHPGSHGSTFGGNPMACAAGNAVMDVIVEDDLLGQVKVKSVDFRSALESLVTEFPEQIDAIRGRGFHLALALREAPLPFIAKLRDNGLLCAPAGANAVRLLPPLNVTSDELNEALVVLRKTLKD